MNVFFHKPVVSFETLRNIDMWKSNEGVVRLEMATELPRSQMSLSRCKGGGRAREEGKGKGGFAPSPSRGPLHARPQFLVLRARLLATQIEVACMKDAVEFTYTGSAQVLSEDNDKELSIMAHFLVLPQLDNLLKRFS